MKQLFALILLSLTLTGCVVEPGGGYGDRSYGDRGYRDRAYSERAWGDHEYARPHFDHDQNGYWGR